MNYKVITTLVFLSLLLMSIITACKGPSQPSIDGTEPQTPLKTEVETAYPINGAYPVGAESAYPIMYFPEGVQRGPDFDINEPVTGGDTVVTGTGPAGVPIELVNLSLVDVVLSETGVDENGKFTFELVEPLESNHTIGIKLGDLSDTDFHEENFIYNEKYYERPYVGILFDIIYVE